MQALLFDWETTGLIDSHLVPHKRQPHGIEFYGCLADLSTGEISEELDLLIKPPIPVSEEITRITGLDDATLADAPAMFHVFPQIQTLIERAPIAMAHNLSYDKELTDLEAERLQTSVSWPRLLCTVEATIHIKGFRLSLTALHEHLFGETFPAAHRARNDVMAMKRCVVELYRLGEI